MSPSNKVPDFECESAAGLFFFRVSFKAKKFQNKISWKENSCFLNKKVYSSQNNEQKQGNNKKTRRYITLTFKYDLTYLLFIKSHQPKWKKKHCEIGNRKINVSGCCTNAKDSFWGELITLKNRVGYWHSKFNSFCFICTPLSMSFLSVSIFGFITFFTDENVRR